MYMYVNVLFFFFKRRTFIILNYRKNRTWHLFSQSGHRTEVLFYQSMGGLEVLPVPRLFFAQDMGKTAREGVIVMEDLSASALAINFIDGYRLEQVSALAIGTGIVHQNSTRRPLMAIFS